ncbi:MAG: arylsulfatase [Planctomycetaceae bacterium]|jgi:arylsulfatase A-like enzyme|nr:arylsulfatase [Planctomycetaceae bacterium]
MRVRNFLLLLLFVFPLTLDFSLLAEESAKRPNIVIFLADDLGWADVGWHGNEIKTPNLDKLASQGIRLERFYVQPVCTPTRASLMTGRYPIRYGLQTGVIRPWADYGLPTEEQTLAQALRENGYYTAILGKWHLGETKKKYLPLQRGFDYHYGLYLGALDYYEHTRDNGLDWHRNGQPVREKGYTTDLLAADAVKLIKSHDTTKPLFLYIPFNAVHGPYQEAPDPKWKEHYADLQGKPQRKIYAGMVSTMDTAIGKVVAALKEKGIDDNTLIFFSSDNGGPNPKNITDNGKLRAGKGTLYEGGVRVPAFAVWQGKIKPGTISEQPIHITDLYPTLLKITGTKIKQKLPLDGVDIVETLLENKPSERKEILHNAEPNRGALQRDNWKLVLTNLDKPKQTKKELFYLKDDPNEQNDLATKHPEKVEELLKRYESYAKNAVPALRKPKPKNIKQQEVWGDFNDEN